MIVSQLMWPPPRRRDKEEGASVQVHVNLLVLGGQLGQCCELCVGGSTFFFLQECGGREPSSPLHPPWMVLGGGGFAWTTCLDSLPDSVEGSRARMESE